MTILRHVLVLMAFSVSSFISAQNFKVDGAVFSEKSQEPIPFAYIFLNDHTQNVFIGTISDPEGKFSVNIPSVYHHDTLKVSFVGYHPIAILLDTLRSKSGIKLFLKESTTYLKSVVIRDLSAKELVQKCVGAAHDNYFNVSFLNDCFYWQSIEEDNVYRNLAEGYFTIFENPLEERMKRTIIEHSIVYVNPLVSYQYLEEVENAMNFDLIRVGSSFMNKENFDEWGFAYDHQTSFPENYVLVDAFRLDKMVRLKILINDTDYSFERIDYSYTWNNGTSYNVNDSLFYRLGKVSGTVFYKKDFLKYNLSYIYNDFSYDLYRRYTHKKLFTRRIRNEISVFSSKEFANRAGMDLKKPATLTKRSDIIFINKKEYCQAVRALNRLASQCVDN